MLIKDALVAIPDVMPLHLRAGQVLLYPRHVPPGIFVVLEGALRPLGDPRGPLAPIVAAPFVVPAADKLVEPTLIGIAAVTDAKILFVPRSVLLRDDCVAKLLAAAGMTTVTLHDRSSE